MAEPVPQPGEATRLLQTLTEGTPGAAAAEAALMELVYHELRRLARGQLAGEPAEWRDQTTSLVNEAFLRLFGANGASIAWESRAHFFGAAAEAMRRILVERARRRRTAKRGGGRRPADIDVEELPDTSSKATSPGGLSPDSVDILAIHEALLRLEGHSDRLATVVKLRYFAGLTIEQTGLALGVTSRTINRDWLAARAWLYREMGRMSTDREA